MTSGNSSKGDDVFVRPTGPLIHHYLAASQSSAQHERKRYSKDLRLIRSTVKRLWLTGSEAILSDLKEIAITTEDESTKSMVSREIARWHLHQGRPEDFPIVEMYANEAKLHSTSTSELLKALLIFAICDGNSLGEGRTSRNTLSAALSEKQVSPDLLLAHASTRNDEDSLIRMVNIALSTFRITPIALSNAADSLLFDRLCGAVDLLPVNDGPKVSVIIATYNDVETLPTALGSLQQQTWKNCEFIVVDDCSPSHMIQTIVNRFSADDERVKYIRLPKNMGAYVARNSALDIATGDLITLHDADDWSHPLKIETQVKFMCAHPEVLGCTSEQARCTSKLEFNQLRSNDGFIFLNTSSFMWRHHPVRECLGYWDSVRFGADSEFVKRLKLSFGDKSVVHLTTGPLSFQRQGDGNVTSGELTGLQTLKYGVRKEYAEASDFYHSSGATLLYSNHPSPRPFPAPRMMLPERDDNCKQLSFDVVIVGDIIEGSVHIVSILDLIKRTILDYGSISLVPAIDPERDLASIKVDRRIRSLTIEHQIYIAVYGETLTCSLAILASPLVPDYRHMPKVHCSKWIDTLGNDIGLAPRAITL